MSTFRFLATATLALASSPVSAKPAPLSSLDSFRIGNKGVVCTAQSRSSDPRFQSMFDRGYEVVCRDAATAVGKLYALKVKGGDFATQFAATRKEKLDCAAAAPFKTTSLSGLQHSLCRDAATGLNSSIFWLQQGNTVFAAEGLVAYDSALQLGLQALLADRPVAGEVTVATTNAGDPAALARVQAASLDPTQALAAGYVRTNEGSFAEASEFFESLVSRHRINEVGASKPAEYLANQAIQQSNLGNSQEAERLFGEAEKVADRSDPLFARLFRNLKAMHQLNSRNADATLAQLDQAVPAMTNSAGTPERLQQGFIDRQLSQKLETEDNSLSSLGGGSSRLTDSERAILLDAQRLYIRGVALRIKQNLPEAKAEFAKAMQTYGSVRSGAVRSMAWLQAGAATELAQLAEAEKNLTAAAGYLEQADAIYQTRYPESATALAAKARVANLQARTGNLAASIPTYRALVASGTAIPGGAEALRAQIKPYFDALVSLPLTDKTAAADFFAASQALVRPGVAQTQAVFARELSGGSDEASGLFRESVNLTRELVSLDVEIARLSANPERKVDEQRSLMASLARKAQMANAQTALLAKLSAFPKFRVMANSTLALPDLQAKLRPGEGYYKLMLVDDAAYAVLAQPDNARIFKLDSTRQELETLTNTVRDSIVLEVNNQLTTNPFDVVAARLLYVKLFGPVDAQIKGLNHLIFEPDGPLLKLPANVLVTEQSSVDAYQARVKKPNADEFDFTGTAWLGRNRMVSTAVSAQSFLDVRALPPSKAKHRYLGLGQNTPTAKLSFAPHSDAGRDPCDWGLSLWDKPISGKELELASTMLGGADNLVITGDGYSDSMLRDRADLKDYRIVQFATHGLVTASHPGCPARPALVTSYGQKNSDGLLSFKEIFDLRFDADTVILSACDTAGAATSAATREAGITTGGNFALDGLVRAFVGAGARAVIASHWPVPDDYDATKKLMSGLYSGGTTMPMGEAMRQSQARLMNDAVTSHPYYWAAFALVGDASKPLTTANAAKPIVASNSGADE